MESEQASHDATVVDEGAPVVETVVIKTNSVPELPGAIQTKTKQPRIPSQKQLEALDANRKKRQAEASARKAAKLADKAAAVAASAEARKSEAVAAAVSAQSASASIVASIPPSIAAQQRKRSAEIAEIPAALKRLETKLDARMQSVMDAMTRIQKAAVSNSVPLNVPLRHFPKPTKSVLRLISSATPTRTPRVTPALYSNRVKSDSEDVTNQVPSKTAVGFAGAVESEEDELDAYDLPENEGEVEPESEGPF